MADASLQFGGDLSLSSTGDLGVVSSAVATEQRVLRRLLTNPGGYIFHLKYGAGLPRQVGLIANAVRISALIKRQMRLERGVGPIPAPSVSVASTNTGTVTATVRYADQSGTPQVLTVKP